MDTDVVIIGAGVIGLAIGRKMSEEGHSVIVLEKEAVFGAGISSRNTEVIHAGIYYQAGSLKARLCLRGKELLYAHCRKYNIRHKRLGKIFLAVRTEEISRLEATRKQGEANGVDDLVMLDQRDLEKMEPEIQGMAGLHSPSSGILDSHALMKSLLRLGRNSGMIFAPNCEVIGAQRDSSGWNVRVRQDESLKCRVVINAAGLYAVSLSKAVFPDRKVPGFYPSKGSYARLSGESPVNHIIYPAILPGVIEERVDATPGLEGSLRFGPNIEEVKSLADFSVNAGVVSGMAHGIKRYLPLIEEERLHPDCSGIRPKIYGPKDPVEDFRFDWAEEPGWLDLWGIESPGLTASLAIAEHVYELIVKRALFEKERIKI